MREAPRARPRNTPKLAGLALAAALFAAPAGADRLPLRGGRWIETRGAWQIRGARVVYTSAEGRLRSLPLAEVALGRPSPGAVRETEPIPATEYPWGRPVPIRPPQPPPGRPWRRADSRAPAPPRCLLRNAEAGAGPEWICAHPAPSARSR